ncbi:transposase [Streptomyces sp. NBC_00161]|uniref:transposase n=1 Tax=Streptomyces sp. NBC_00161 TaxID=2975671 RepID=UPI0032550BA1
MPWWRHWKTRSWSSVRTPSLSRPARPRTWTRRQLVGGIRWRSRAGTPWREVPERYGPWDRIYELPRRWQRDGTWKRTPEAPQVQSDAERLMSWHVSGQSSSQPARWDPMVPTLRRSATASMPLDGASSRTCALGRRCGLKDPWAVGYRFGSSPTGCTGQQIEVAPAALAELGAPRCARVGSRCPHDPSQW